MNEGAKDALALIADKLKVSTQQAARAIKKYSPGSLDDLESALLKLGIKANVFSLIPQPYLMTVLKAVSEDEVRPAEQAIDRMLQTEDDAAAILRYYYFDRPLHESAKDVEDLVWSALGRPTSQLDFKGKGDKVMVKVTQGGDFGKAQMSKLTKALKSKGYSIDKQTSSGVVVSK